MGRDFEMNEFNDLPLYKKKHKIRDTIKPKKPKKHIAVDEVFGGDSKSSSNDNSPFGTPPSNTPIEIPLNSHNIKSAPEVFINNNKPSNFRKNSNGLDIPVSKSPNFQKKIDSPKTSFFTESPKNSKNNSPVSSYTESYSIPLSFFAQPSESPKNSPKSSPRSSPMSSPRKKGSRTSLLSKKALVIKIFFIITNQQ